MERVNNERRRDYDITNHDFPSCFESSASGFLFLDCTFGELAAPSFRPSLGVDEPEATCSSAVLPLELLGRFSGFDFCFDEACEK